MEDEDEDHAGHGYQDNCDYDHDLVNVINDGLRRSNDDDGIDDNDDAFNDNENDGDEDEGDGDYDDDLIIQELLFPATDAVPATFSSVLKMLKNRFFRN